MLLSYLRVVAYIYKWYFIAIKMEIKKDLVIKKVTLNNKWRKGDYIYIREKGQNGSYYKYDSSASIEDYLYLYRAKLKTRKLGVKAIVGQTDAGR